MFIFPLSTDPLEFEIKAGYDSEEVLQERIDAIQEVMERMAYAKMVVLSYVQPMFCLICGTVLGPIPDDNNHHISAIKDDLTFDHFCAAHCPSCSTK